MKEFDEKEAIEAMMAPLSADRRDYDATCEVLDIIFDYYDENGDLDIDFDEDEDDAEADVEEIAAYTAKVLGKSPADVDFTIDEIKAMIKAEIEYENSLLL